MTGSLIGGLTPQPTPVSLLALSNHSISTDTNRNLTEPHLPSNDQSFDTTVTETLESEKEYPSLPSQGINFSALRILIHLLEQLYSKRNTLATASPSMATQKTVDDMIQSFTDSLKKLDLESLSDKVPLSNPQFQNPNPPFQRLSIHNQI